MYSLEHEEWTEMPSMGTARLRYSCALFVTNIYVLGGKGLMLTEIFDLNTNTWTSGPNMKNIFDYGQAFTFPPCVLVVKKSRKHMEQIFLQRRCVKTFRPLSFQQKTLQTICFLTVLEQLNLHRFKLSLNLYF